MEVFVAAGAIEFGQPFSGMCFCQSYHSYERCYVQHASPAAFGVQNDAHTCGSDNPQTLVDDEVSWWHLVQEGSIVHVCDILQWNRFTPVTGRLRRTGKLSRPYVVPKFSLLSEVHVNHHHCSAARPYCLKLKPEYHRKTALSPVQASVPQFCDTMLFE
jgi:hypothetical protein